MLQQRATVKWNRPAGPDCFHLGLDTDPDFANAVPGQFVMVQVGDQGKPLLRRPFSVFGRIGDQYNFEGLELLIKVVGRGTELLSQMQPGSELDLLGPLGHGFRVNSKHERVYLAAGGIGIAPIRFLATELVRQRGASHGCRLFLGGRSRQDLLCRDDFRELGIPVTVSTDDGSDGDQCLITDPLEVAIQDQSPDIIYACGPRGMLACVAGIAERSQVPCQVSVETVMACGLGACLGCAVGSKKDPDTYLHACVNGPVFNIEDIHLPA